MPATHFDLAGARKAGASDAAIAGFLATERGFDIAGARKAGATDTAIAEFLAQPVEVEQSGLIARGITALNDVRKGMQAQTNESPAGGFEQISPLQANQNAADTARRNDETQRQQAPSITGFEQGRGPITIGERERQDARALRPPIPQRGAEQPFMPPTDREQQIARSASGADNQQFIEQRSEQPRGWTDTIADGASQLGMGITQIASAPVGLFAPDSELAQRMQQIAKNTEATLTPTTRSRLQVGQQRIEEAAKTGRWDEAKAVYDEYLTDPVLAQHFIVTTVPSFLAVLGPAKAAQLLVAMRGGSAAAGASAASLAAGAGNAVLTGGDARQHAFDDLYRTYKDSGLADEQAKAQALQESQLVAGVGMGLGWFGGRYGAEAAVLGNRSKLLTSGAAALRAFGRELGTEFAEELIPLVLTNSIASRTDGRDPLKDVLGTAGQTLLAAGPMAGVGAVGAARAPTEIDLIEQSIEGAQFDPTQIDQAARNALAPGSAQMQALTDLLIEREVAAIETGDAVEIALTRLENETIRGEAITAAQPPTPAPSIDTAPNVGAAPDAVPVSSEVEAGFIDQAALLASAQVAAAPLLMSNGQPFRTEHLAAASARQRGLAMIPVQVGTGWGLVPAQGTPIAQNATALDTERMLDGRSATAPELTATTGPTEALTSEIAPDQSEDLTTPAPDLNAAPDQADALTPLTPLDQAETLLPAADLPTDRATIETPTTPAPMLMKSGQPFRTERLAASSAKQRKLELVPVPVEGGWGLVPAAMPVSVEAEQTAPVAPATHQATPIEAEQPTPPANRFEVVQPDGTVFGKYSDQRDAEGALVRAGAGAQVIDRQASTMPTPAPVTPTEATTMPTPAPTMPTRTRADGRTALLAEIEQAKAKTAAPELVAEYTALLNEATEARRRASLKKTKQAEARTLTQRADQIENDVLPGLRERIGYVTFKAPHSSYRILNTPNNLAAFAKKVSQTAAFRGLPPVDVMYPQLETPTRATEAPPPIVSNADIFAAGQVEGAQYATDAGPRTTGQIRSAYATVESAEQAAHTLAGLRKSSEERFQVLVLDADSKPLAVLNLFAGATAETSIYPGVVAKAVYETPGAARIWIAHNHPSGNTAPSAADERLTRMLAQSFGEGTGVELAGHVVIAGARFTQIDNQGNTVGQPGAAIPAGARTQTIRVTERRVKKVGRLDNTITSPSEAREIVKRIANGRAGVVFLDAANGPTGFLPMNAEQMATLRDGRGARLLYGGAARANAAGVIIYFPAGVDLDAAKAGMRNIGEALDGREVRFVDALHDYGTGIRSFAETGESLTHGRGGVFKSRTDDAPAHSTPIPALTAAFKRDFPGLAKALDRMIHAGKEGARGGVVFAADEAALAQAFADKTGRTLDEARQALQHSRAWHGTPHRFEKFSLDAMGTGEGAQAYGWGLYFADAREVAEHYRTGLSYKQIVREFRDELPDDADFDDALEAAESMSPHRARVIRALAADGWLGFDYPAQAITAAFRELGAYDASQDLKDAVNGAQGQLYTVELAPADDQYLLWDKPLSEQSAAVHKALAPVMAELEESARKLLSAFSQGEIDREIASARKTTTGEDLYNKIGLLKGSDKAASEYLASLGVRGIKYLDGASRAGSGDAKFNYVIFNDADVSIVEVMFSRSGAINGFYDPQSGLTFINQGAVTEDTIGGVLLHEAMHGGQNAEVDTKAMQLVADRNHATTPKALRVFLDRVADRMQAAGVENDPREASAYIVEEAARFGRENGLSALDGKFLTWLDGRLPRVAKFLRDWLAGIRAWGLQHGRNLNPTVDDLVALARQNLTAMSRGVAAAENGTVRHSAGAATNTPATPGQGAQPAQPAPPAETRARAIQRKWQDQFSRFTVIQDWLKAQGVQLTEGANVYRAEERMHGRTATRIEDFRERRIKPLVKKVRDAGFSMTDVAEFLHAQHAEERNAQIARINSDMPDGGSGMTTAEARTKLAEYSTNMPGLAALANEIRAISDDSRQMLLDAGLITEEMSDAWQATYAHYVPLKGGPVEDAAQQGTGRGLTVKERQKRALGHGTREGGEWIIENLLRDHERAILQVEKNRVGQHLLKLAIEAGHPDLITIGKPEKRKVLRDQKAYEVRYHGTVVEAFANRADAQRYVGREALRPGRNPGDFEIAVSHDLDVVFAVSPMLDPFETQVYVNGHAIRVQFKDELLGRAWNNMGAEHMNTIFRLARAVNTYLSRMYTAYNPEFILTNLARDFSTGIANMTGEEGAVFAAKAAAHYGRSFGELLRYAWTGNASNAIKAYRADGGTTGAAYLSDLERIGRDVQAAYLSYAGLAEAYRTGGPRRAARVAGKVALDVFLGWIEKLNQAGENAMRLAVYRTAVDTGKTRAQAAALAKNSTVNFNRRGEYGQMMGALYLFFNPAVQGSASVAHAMFKGKHKHQVQALTGGIVALGYLLASSMGGGPEDEWEKVGDFAKERFIHVWTGDGWARIPIPYGYGFFVNLGRQMHALEQGEERAVVALRLAQSFMDEFSVWGSAFDAEGDERNILFLAPTLVQIPGAVVANRTGLGSPIYPEAKYDESRPDHLKMWRATQGTLWAETAKQINLVSGGSAIEKGWLDISPETFKYLWRTATGGAGKFFTDSAALGWNVAMEGLPASDIEVAEIPVVRKFVADANNIKGARSRFWAATNEAREAAELFSRARKVEDHATRRTEVTRVAHEYAEMIALSKATDRFVKAIAAQRDAVQAVMSNEVKTLVQRRAEVRQIEARESELYDQFVTLFKEQKERQKARTGTGG